MTDVAPVRIVIAGPRDLPGVISLMADAFDPRFGEAWSGSQLVGALAIPDTWVQIALGPNGVLGFTLVRRILDEAELMLVAVAPARRTQGLGRQLIEGALAQSHARGARSIFLEVRESNNAACKLYQAAGFIEIGRRRDYYSGPKNERFDAITLRRTVIE